MMKHCVWWLATVMSIAVASPAVSRSEVQALDCGRLSPNVELGFMGIGECQLRLEQRRPGGVRPRVARAVLDLFSRSEWGLPRWASAASGFCHAGTLDCEDLATEVERALSRVPKGYVESVQLNIRGMREHAKVQRIPRAQLEEALRRRMKGDTTPSPIDPRDPEQAALLALYEGFGDLADEIEQTLRTHAFPGSHPGAGVLAEIEMLRIKRQGDPVPRLMAIIDAEVQRDVAAHLSSEIKNGRSSGVIASPLFELAVAELRRLNPPGSAEKLQPLVAAYDKVVARCNAYLAEHPMAERQEESLAPAAKVIPYPSATTRVLAELAGDLGDRELERRTLGGQTLWDQVNALERKLVKKGQLSSSATVTIETAEK